MSVDPILAGINTFLVLSIALCPVQLCKEVQKLIFGKDDPSTGYAVFGLLLFLAAFPLGYWAYQSFEVVWR